MEEKKFEAIDPALEKIARAIVDSAYHVHKQLGPGLLEKVYEICLCHELAKRGVSTLRQIDIPIKYDGMTFNEGLRLDILAADEIIIETKAIDQVNPLWEAQVLSHLKLTGKRLGFLINFNVIRINHGIKRIVL